MEKALSEYNEAHDQMELLLFSEAIEHVCRITRAISRGHAMLVGDGGLGKNP